jgi:undecaprenyl-diphosphatase
LKTERYSVDSQADKQGLAAVPRERKLKPMIEPGGRRDVMSKRISALLQPHRLDSRVLVGFLALAASLLGLMKLASEVAEGDTFALDRVILRGLRTPADAAIPLGPAWLKAAMIDFTALGGTAVLTLVTVFAVGLLVALRKFRSAGFVALSISCGALLSTASKGYFIRPRPELVPHLVAVNSPSFPSGHAMNSAVVYLTLAVLLARTQERRSVQVYLIAAALVLTVLIGCTRVVLGVHWPSDVLAGWTAGAAWAAISSIVAKILQRGQRIENPNEEHGQPASV